MTKRSFASLYAKLEASPSYRAEKLAVAFLAELNASMHEQGISNAELARRIGASAAYVTKVFRGPSNLSVETLAKLADAVGCQVHLHLAKNAVSVRWFDVYHQARGSERESIFDADQFNRLLSNPVTVEQETSNDEKFALAA